MVSSPGTGNAAGSPVGFVAGPALHAVRAPSDSPPDFSSLPPHPAAATATAATAVLMLIDRLVIGGTRPEEGAGVLQGRGDELVGAREVGGDDPQGARRRQDHELRAAGVALDVVDQPAVHQQAEGVH